MRKVFGTGFTVIAVFAFVLAGSQGVSAEVVTVAPEVVTGSRIYTDLDEVPAPTYVITAEDIASSGASDLGALLESRIPGIFMKKKSGLAQQSEIAVRGITTEILVMFNGIPHYRSSHLADGATVDFRSFPLEDIERVEVVKGGASAIYGSMAAGGVINIITKKPQKDEGRFIAETGSSGWRRYYVSGSAVTGDMGAGIWYERLEEGRKRLFYITVPENRFDSLGYRGDAYGFDLSGKGWTLHGVFGDYEYRFRNEFGLNDEKKQYNRFSFRHDWEKVYLLAGYDTQEYSFPLVEGRFYNDRAFTAEIGGKEAIGEALLAWGFFYRYEDTEFSDGWGDPVTSKGRYNLAPFSEISFVVGDWVTNLGLRYEIWDQGSVDYHEIIPKLSLQRQFSEGDIFYLSASRVFAMPSFYELFIDSPYSFGNPNLTPERGWSYEMGLKSPGFETWSLGLFLVSLQDKIKFDNNWPGTWLNIAEFRSYGVEFTKRWDLGVNWLLELNGTWQCPEEKADDSSGWVRSYGVPEWEIGVLARYSSDPWKVDLYLNWAANQAGFFSSPWSSYDWDADDYIMVDIIISWESGDDAVRIKCANLFNSDHTYRSGNYYYYSPERGLRLIWERSF